MDLLPYSGMWGNTPTLLGPLKRANLKHNLSKESSRVGVSPTHLRTEGDLLSEILCFLVSRTPDDGQNPKIQ
jgi:hypothetical protein